MSDSYRHSAARIKLGHYLVEVLQGNDTSHPFWYYMLQRDGSDEILDIAKFESYEEALASGVEVLERLERGGVKQLFEAS